MRHVILSVLLALALGCGKKDATPDANTGDQSDAAPDPAAERAKLLAPLKSAKGDALRAAVDSIAARAASDPQLIGALVELLKDTTNAGAGKTHPAQITSTREAAAVALKKAGPQGEAALKEKGFPILRDGLNDTNPAVKEHTAHTLGRLGPLAQPLSPDVQKLIADPDPTVRGVAADAVRDIGVTDVAGLANLLANSDPDIRRLAAEVLFGVSEVPANAVEPIAAALDDEDERIRVAAANALAIAGPKAGPTAAGKLADAIRKTYPLRYDEKVGWTEGAELAYWQALVQIGEPAIAALSGLLEHTNIIVRYYAAMAIGEVGPSAKDAVPVLRKRLNDSQEHGQVRIEVASALCRIGTDTEEAAALIKQSLDTPLARYAIAAIPRMGPAGKPLIPLALEKLASEEPDTRYAAVQLVAMLEPDDAAKAVPELAKLVSDPEPEIRRAVGAVLEKLGPAAGPAAAAVAKVLPTEPEEIVRDQYADALIAMGPGAKPAATVLVQLIDEQDLAQSMRLRVIVASAVADPANPVVASALVRATRDRDELVRAAAATALGKLNPLPADALAALVKLAKSDSRYPPRFAAVRALAEAGPRAKAARSELEALTKGSMPGVALWAKVALAAVDGNVQSAAGVIRAGLSDTDGQAREAAAEALLLIGPTPADLPALTAMLKGPTGKAAAARTLGRLGPAAKEAVPRLADLLEDRESGVRIAAAEALGQIGAPAAIPAIPKLQAALKDPLVAPTARKSLEKLGVKETRGKE